MCCRKLMTCVLLSSAALMTPSVFAQDQEPPSPEEIAAAMEEARKFTEPGENHEFLNRFVGKWKTQTQFYMGSDASPPEEGESEFSWMIEGRWLQSHTRGQMFGRPYTSHSLMGYDNFKQSFVVAAVSSLDTAMHRAEGDLTQDKSALLLYGRMDEYLTGEHDKMVKTVWRFKSDDNMVMEVHDLPIGETNTKVVEITFTRIK